MNALQSKIKRFKELKDSIDTITKEVIQKAFTDNERLVLDENREQLKRGIRSNGSQIDPFYSSKYAQDKKGGNISPVNLKDTGKYYAEFFIEFENDGVVIRSKRFEKGFNVREWLIKRYGEKIEGVSKEFLKDFCENFVTPVLQEKVKIYLNER